MPNQFFSRAQAAEHIRSKGLPCSRLTLQKYATVGGGPEYQKFGARVVYTAEGLDRWIASKLSSPMASTSRAAA